MRGRSTLWRRTTCEPSGRPWAQWPGGHLPRCTVGAVGGAQTRASPQHRHPEHHAAHTRVPTTKHQVVSQSGKFRGQSGSSPAPNASPWVLWSLTPELVPWAQAAATVPAQASCSVLPSRCSSSGHRGQQGLSPSSLVHVHPLFFLPRGVKSQVRGQAEESPSTYMVAGWQAVARRWEGGPRAPSYGLGSILPLRLIPFSAQ